MSLEARQEFFARSESVTPYVATTSTAGPTFLVRTQDHDIGHALFVKRDRGDMRVVSRAVRAVQIFHSEQAVVGKTFVDVGANIGTTVIAALLNHDFADGVAIEPEPVNHQNLVLNLILNDLDERVTPLLMAAGDVTGSTQLLVDESHSGKHRIAGEKTADGATVIPVSIRTLDDLAELGVIEPERVGMVWINAQAHEARVLAGATSLTDRGCPVVFEWNPKSLAGAGSLDQLTELVRESYTHFVDMRRNPDPSAPPYELRSIAGLASFTESFLGDDAERRFTDVLAVRLTDEEAALADLAILGEK